MGWERGFYYRKQRRDGKVRSVYVGGGLMGELAALKDAEAQVERRAQTEQRAQMRSAAAAADAEYKQLHCMVAAVLLASGYHTHKRAWRRLRDR